MNVPDIGFTPTIPALIRHLVEQWGEREFLVTPDGRLTYGEAERTTRRVAKELLARGYGKGSRIGFVFANTTDWVVMWLAVARIGGIAMPFPTTYRPAELRKALLIGDTQTLVIPTELFGHELTDFMEDAIPALGSADEPVLRLNGVPCLSHVLTTTPSGRAWAGEIDLQPGAGSDHDVISDDYFCAVEAQVHPSDPMLVIFTSGTTAEPKGVVHSHGTYVRHAYNIADANDIVGGQRVVGGAPFFWIGGVSHTLGPLMARGNTLLCTPKFDAEGIIDLVEREDATVVTLFPYMTQRVIEHARRTGRDPSSIPLPAPSDIPADRRTAPLGMTETCATYVAGGPRGHVIPEEYRGAQGFPVPMSEYRIADLMTGETLPEGVEGEICVRGYSLMLGMCKRERHELFDDDGWYHTGDKGYLAGPYIFFTGRAKDLIKSAGANVAPREVEVVLDSHPDVLTSVVVGLDDPQRGEIVGAVVVPSAGATIDPVALVTWANRELSSYKVPRRVVVVGESDVPYLGTGKLDRRTLADRLRDGGIDVSPSQA